MLMKRSSEDMSCQNKQHLVDVWVMFSQPGTRRYRVRFEYTVYVQNCVSGIRRGRTDTSRGQLISSLCTRTHRLQLRACELKYSKEHIHYISYIF